MRLMAFVSICSGTSSWANSISWEERALLSLSLSIYIHINLYIYIYINLSTNVRGILSEENRIRMHAKIDLGAAKTSQKYPSQRNDQSRKQHTGCCELHIGQNAANGLCFDLLGQIVLG